MTIPRLTRISIYSLALVWGTLVAVQGARAADPVNCAEVVASPLARQGDSQRTWFRSGDSPRAVALIIHGLNTKPAKMEGIANLLTSRGIDALNVGLSGHNGNVEVFKEVTRDQWIEDALLGYCMARAEADQERVPLYFVGFSLGGAVGLDLETGETSNYVHFDRMVLLSPAAKVRARSRLVKLLYVFGPHFMVPSLNNKGYRANPGTSIAAYRALFAIVHDLDSGNFAGADVPTLLLIDPRDELVSESKLRRLIDSEHLDQWRLEEVSNAGATLKPTYHHLIIDQASLGTEEWSRVSADILALFDVDERARSEKSLGTD